MLLSTQEGRRVKSLGLPYLAHCSDLPSLVLGVNAFVSVLWVVSIGRREEKGLLYDGGIQVNRICV